MRQGSTLLTYFFLGQLGNQGDVGLSAVSSESSRCVTVFTGRDAEPGGGRTAAKDQRELSATVGGPQLCHGPPSLGEAMGHFTW